MKWLLKNITEEDVVLKEKLIHELGVSANIAHLLILRNIKNFDEAKKFFRPSLDDLHSPFLMKDMDLAVNRLHQAIQNKEKILIYGDYDVDGTTAVASMYLFLNKLTHNHLLHYYLPNRFEEGYGVSYQGIEFAKNEGIDLMIILDCGIKEVEKIHYAQSLGIDCIICDHHLPSEQLPNATAILNPKRKDCSYPYKELTGCGIGFKLMQAYCIQYHLNKNLYLNMLDLVATSIAADIVPITDENRILTYYGLKKMNERPSVGLKKLIDISFTKRNRDIKVSDIVFIIAPRINAAGRIDHASKALQLLIAETEEQAEQYAKELHDVNAQRQDIDKQTLEEAIQIIENDKLFSAKKTTVVFKENWNKGVVGIVAAKLVEKYYRPTIVLTEHNGYITGSARSINGFDLYTALLGCKEYLYQFGGHSHAAGLSIEKHNLDIFIQQFEILVKQQLSPEQEEKKIYADNYLRLDEIDNKFLRILKQFEPHGPHNMHPVFWLKDVRDSGRMYEVGNGHLRMHLTQHSHKEFPAMFYNGSNYFEKLKNKSFDCLCKIDIKAVQSEHPVYDLIIEDIKINSTL
ncbi:MAG: single-stranded-DNA-specific exonuclease RecJ [Bacteroidia bacterium]|nr:single-stranded-DNA-specific exonuclease RecJ [Bacteroidia bacterium]